LKESIDELQLESTSSKKVKNQKMVKVDAGIDSVHGKMI
jgi:hypothetical protein